MQSGAIFRSIIFENISEHALRLLHSNVRKQRRQNKLEWTYKYTRKRTKKKKKENKDKKGEIVSKLFFHSKLAALITTHPRLLATKQDYPNPTRPLKHLSSWFTWQESPFF